MPNYLNAASNTRIVAVKVAEFIVLNKIDPKKIHCIGKLFENIIIYLT